jgi:hypothetical protein
MNWITLTAADVSAALDADRMEQARRMALEPGQADPIAAAIENAVLHVRGYTARFTVNGPEGTVPDFLKRTTVALVAGDLLNRIGVAAMTEGVKSPAELAQKRLEALTEADFPSGTTTGAVASGVASSTTRLATRTKMEGIY